MHTQEFKIIKRTIEHKTVIKIDSENQATKKTKNLNKYINVYNLT